MEMVEVGLRHRSAIGLIGAAVSDHPQIDEIATRIVDRGARLSVSSLRADSVSPAVLDALARSGAKSLTIAPEAGSERLRAAIAKDISDTQIMDTLTRAARAGLREAKLYFMIGLARRRGGGRARPSPPSRAAACKRPASATSPSPPAPSCPSPTPPSNAKSCPRWRNSAAASATSATPSAASATSPWPWKARTGPTSKAPSPAATSGWRKS